MGHVTTAEETPIYHEVLLELGLEGGLFEDEFAENVPGRGGSHRVGEAGE